MDLSGEAAGRWTMERHEYDLTRIPPTLVLRRGQGDGYTCACATSALSLARVDVPKDVERYFTDRDDGISRVVGSLTFRLNDGPSYGPSWWGTQDETEEQERTRLLMPRDASGLVLADSFVARQRNSAAAPDVEAYRTAVTWQRSLCTWLPTALEDMADACDTHDLRERANSLRDHATMLRAYPISKLYRAARDALAALDALAARAADPSARSTFVARRRQARDDLHGLILELIDIREVPADVVTAAAALNAAGE